MTEDFSDAPVGFVFTTADSGAKPTRFEDEVISLFDQLRAPVLRYLLSFGVSVPDAEEIVQEVFLALFKHLRMGKPRSNLQAWVFKVAHNSALKCRLRVKQQADRFNGGSGVTEMLADPEPNPEANAVALQRRRRLLAVVRALPEQDQSCLSLRAEGLRYREIAEVLGISLGSVAASLEKSLSRLTRAEQF